MYKLETIQKMYEIRIGTNIMKDRIKDENGAEILHSMLQRIKTYNCKESIPTNNYKKSIPLATKNQYL